MARKENSDDFFNISFIDLISGALGIMSILLLVVVPFIGDKNQENLTNELSRNTGSQFAFINITSIGKDENLNVKFSKPKDEKEEISSQFWVEEDGNFVKKKMIRIDPSGEGSISIQSKSDSLYKIAIQTDTMQYYQGNNKELTIYYKNGALGFNDAFNGRKTMRRKETKRDTSIAGIEFVFVEGNAEIPDFFIGKYELTYREYFEIYQKYSTKEIEREKYLHEKNELGFSNYPILLYLYEINELKEWLGKFNPMYQFDLPTYDEWLYAARGGKKSLIDFKYSGSNNLDEVGWYGENSEISSHEVGTKDKPNELGIFDMSGNQYERVNLKGNENCFCGGGFNSKKEDCEIGDNSTNIKRFKVGKLGLRLIYKEK